MTRYLLDNSVLVAYLKGRPGALRRIRPWIAAQEAATSLVIYGEAIEYMKSDPEFDRRRFELRALLRTVTPYRLSYPILERYADLRRLMRTPYGSGPIGDIDTLIAATALEHNLTVVTLDGDYLRVPGLSVLRFTREDLL